jgi:uncharacterized membrane protein YraQ (UPF0718 family)
MDPNAQDLIIHLSLFGHPVAFNLKDFIIHFTSILYEALPFIILGAVIAGLLEELLPQRLVARFLPRSRLLAILIGGLLGLVFPMCECGIIPVMRRLLRKGFPLSCCIAYLLAGPIINVIVLTSTYVAFSVHGRFADIVTIGGKPTYQMGSVWMMSMRALGGYIVAVITALIVERAWQKHGKSLLTPLAQPGDLPGPDEETDKAAERKPLRKRIENIAETALHDFIDITVFLILGGLLAATVRQVLTHEDINYISVAHPSLALLMMMALAILLCLCSEADAFVAASFVSLPSAAKLGFLVLGPMMDFKLYMMYTRVFRPRLIWTIIIAVVIQVFIFSTVVGMVWERWAPEFVKPSAVPTSTVQNPGPNGG